MSVIVKGMEIQRSCFDCDFLKLSSVCVCLVCHFVPDRNKVYTIKRHEKCHLKPIDSKQEGK